MANPGTREGLRQAAPEVLRWVDEIHGVHDAALARAFTAPLRMGLPPIQVAQQEGALLTLLMRLIAARRVVEVGTLAGYSALRLARGLAPGGKLWTLECDPRHAMAARAALAAAPRTVTVQLLEGDAKEVLTGLAEKEAPFDAVFLDADKAGYVNYIRWAAQHLRPAGLLIADNAYLFGRLLEDSDEAQAMRAFHEEAAKSFDTCLIPTPEGLLVSIKRE